MTLAYQNGALGGSAFHALVCVIFNQMFIGGCYSDFRKDSDCSIVGEY